MELEETGSLISDYSTKLQTSMALAQRQKYRSTEQAGKPRDNLTKKGKLCNGGKTVSTIGRAGKTGQLHLK